MSDLLSPMESHEFNSFLSSIDYGASNSARSPTNSDWTTYSTDGIPIPPLPQGTGRAALAKATKDLMALDSWSSPVGTAARAAPTLDNLSSQGSFRFGSFSSQNDYEVPRNNPYNNHPSHRPMMTNVNPTYPSTKQQSPPPLLGLSHPSNNSMPSAPTMNDHKHIRNASVNPHSSPSAPSSSAFSYPGPSNGIGSPHSSSSSNTDNIGGVTTRSRQTTTNKRRLEPTEPSSNKRHRTSPPGSPVATTKSTLLSPSQKKANHIQSEQKRRANIRRGYEALCETVPALKEAIRLEEEQQQALTGAKPAKPKRGRGRGKTDEGTGEKIDGRAGPRSENIVLGKTIEYINELLQDREALLARLHQAKSKLGSDHPICAPSVSPPLWERQWNGGSGKDADVEEEEDEEDEEE